MPPTLRERKDLLHRNPGHRHRAFRRFLHEGVRLVDAQTRRRPSRLRRHDRPSQRNVGHRPSAVADSRPAHLHHGRRRERHDRSDHRERRRDRAAGRRGRARDHGAVSRSGRQRAWAVSATSGRELKDAEAAREFLRERVSNLPAAFIATRHDQNVFAFRFGFGIEGSDRAKNRFLSSFEPHLDYFALDKRQIQTFVSTSTYGYDRVVFADTLGAPPTL